MDVFSATSRQVESAQTPVKTEAPQMTRPVETMQQTTKSVRETNEQNKQEIAQQLNETVDKLNKNMEALDTNIKFGFNDKISMMYVNVMERNTGNLIRKIPTEEAMLLSERMQEIVGTIFDKKG